MPRRSWQAALLAISLAAIATVSQRYPSWFGREATTTSPSVSGPDAFRVARVVDGDTFVLAESKERVRLIGVNTPETVKPNSPVEPWGPEASAFTKNFLAGGSVRLEFDSERRDKYGRLLAYAWVGNRMLNEELIRAGLAEAEMQYRYSPERKAQFRRAEAEAKSAKRGIWSTVKAR